MKPPWAGGLALAACMGCLPRFAPPPRAPERQAVVAEPPRAPTADEGTVAIDVTDGRARVELVTGRTQPDPNNTLVMSGYGRGWQVGVQQPNLTLRGLCLTPCAVNLPRGDHELHFEDLDPSSQRVSTAMVRVGERPSMLRHTLGAQRSDPGGMIGGLLLGGFGIVLMGAGAMLLGFGVSDDGTDLRVGGGVTLGVGAALTLVGTVLGVRARPEIQPGATTQWTP